MKKNVLGTEVVIIVLLILVAMVSFIIRLQHIIGQPGLLSLDPWYFMGQSSWFLSGGQIGVLGYSLVPSDFYYPPLLVMLVSALYKILPFHLITIYQYFGPITMSGMIILAYWAFRSRFSPWSSLAGAVLYSLSPYILYRGALTLPENLGLIFLLIAIKGVFSWRRKDWHWIVVGLVGWLLMLTSHGTAFYIAPILLVWVLIIDRPTLRQFLAGLLIVSIITFIVLIGVPDLWSIALSLARAFVGGRFYYAWPDWRLVINQFGIVIFWSGVAGLIASIMGCFFIQQRKNAILTLIGLMPFAILLFFYQGDEGDFGPILPERFYIITIFMASLALVFALDWLTKMLRPIFQLSLALALVALSAWLTVSQPLQPWFWVFSPQEIEAAEWLKAHTPQDSIVLAQPLLNWLIRPVSERTVIWNEPLLEQPADKQREFFSRFQAHSRPKVIMLSKQKTSSQYQAIFSDGTKQLVGYPDRYLLPNLDRNQFQKLPILFENSGTIIYDYRWLDEPRKK